MYNLRFQQLIFALSVVAAGVLATLFERSVLPAGILAGENGVRYALDLACVVLCTVGTYVALRLFTFAKVRFFLKTQYDKAYYKTVFVRTMMILVSLLTEVAVYYLFLPSQTAQYTLFITLVSAVFCIPTARERAGLLEDKEPA